ncbi:MAG: alpha/beta fold hydrolase [Desulfopila sp.]|nr:alpha/beta fold hydrolase [Desulfopila sp.]
MNNRPDLEKWHTTVLQAEFKDDMLEQSFDFEKYRRLEERLFDELERVIYADASDYRRDRLNRYAAGSWSDRHREQLNWNKTFEMEKKEPKAMVLMLHGLSDSPYSMRTLAESLHSRGAWVLGLRLPGHGTIPAALTEVRWQDFTAAVRLAAKYLHKKGGGKTPLYLVGYSNGAALALEYALSRMAGEALPEPVGMVLLSPAVAVSPLAFLADWNMKLAHLPGLEKLAWLSIDPEYDPYKYNSFAVNAGAQIRRLTARVAALVKKLDSDNGIEGFPAVLAFQSVVDDTIPPKALVDRLLNHLATGSHELVLFDLNRLAADLALLRDDPYERVDKLFAEKQPFTLTLLSNRESERHWLEERRKRAMESEIISTPLQLRWPQGVFSLSHLALPFSSEDPVYGTRKSTSSEGFSLGALEVKGERGVLLAAPGDLIRLRYNPFYSYLEERTLDWIVPLSGVANPLETGGQ